MASASKKTAVKEVTSDDKVSFVNDLAEILDKAGLAELEYKTEALAIRLSRLNGAAPVPAVQPVAPAAAAPLPARVGEPAAEVAGNPVDHPGTVKSPMVGTVYTAPEPDAPTFITEGDSVSKGQTLLIVEAMKVMNEIQADFAGEIIDILEEDGSSVEYGQALFKIRKS